MSLIFGFLKIFDRFKRPILLYSNKSQNHSTRMGVAVSLSIYGFLLYFLINSDMVTRKNAKITDQSVESNFRPEVQLKNMVFDLSDDESISYMDPSIFTFQGLVRYLKVNEVTKNGFEFVYDMVEDLRPCLEEDFEAGVFEKMGFRNKFCFNKKNISVKGYWDEKEVKYVWVKLKRCMNTTENNNFCKSNEEIDKFFYKKYFNIYFLNPFFDLSDYYNPIKSIWRNEYQSSDPNTLKKIYLYFKKVDFIDDKNFPFVPSNVYEGYSFEKRENDLLIEARTQVLFEIVLYSSIIIQKKVRIYQGLPDILANIGGLFGILLFIGFIITEPEFRLNMILGLFTERVSFNRPVNKVLEEKFVIEKPTIGGDRPESSLPNANFRIQEKEFEIRNADFEEEVIRRKKNMSPYVVRRPDSSEGQILIQLDDEPTGRDGESAREGELEMVPGEFDKKVEITYRRENKEQGLSELRQTGEIEPKEEKVGNATIISRKEGANGSGLDADERAKDKGLYNSNKNFKKSETIEKSTKEFAFTIFEYFVYETKKIFKFKLAEKEKFFSKLEGKYMEDLNVGIILQRIFLLESKMELIFNSDHSLNLQLETLRPSVIRPILQKNYTVFDLVEK